MTFKPAVGEPLLLFYRFSAKSAQINQVVGTGLALSFAAHFFIGSGTVLIKASHIRELRNAVK
jgi:hypothetical protein